MEIEIRTGADLISNHFPDALDRSGLTANFVAKKIYEFTTALDSDNLPLYNVQLKAIDMVNRCQGNYQDKMQIEPVRKIEDRLEASIIDKIRNKTE